MRYKPPRKSEVSVAEMNRAIEAVKVSPWQPIETAPRDGTFLILAYYCQRSAGGFEIGAWQTPPDGRPSGWYTSGFRSLEAWLDPTHWMPLPDPPQ